jgi:O-acetylhomoserine/O-acetylserine sulfhydrylase-like pyridoxal-dependent enzyme
MYNWSVDEKKFKNIKEIVNFLRNQPEVIEVKILNRKDRSGNKIIKTKLSLDIHPVKKFCIAKYIEERIGKLKISII